MTLITHIAEQRYRHPLQCYASACSRSRTEDLKYTARMHADTYTQHSTPHQTSPGMYSQHRHIASRIHTTSHSMFLSALRAMLFGFNIRVLHNVLYERLICLSIIVPCSNQTSIQQDDAVSRHEHTLLHNVGKRPENGVGEKQKQLPHGRRSKIGAHASRRSCFKRSHPTVLRGGHHLMRAPPTLSQHLTPTVL